MLVVGVGSWIFWGREVWWGKGGQGRGVDGEGEGETEVQQQGVATTQVTLWQLCIHSTGALCTWCQTLQLHAEVKAAMLTT